MWRKVINWFVIPSYLHTHTTEDIVELIQDSIIDLDDNFNTMVYSESQNEFHIKVNTMRKKFKTGNIMSRFEFMLDILSSSNVNIKAIDFTYLDNFETLKLFHMNNLTQKQFCAIEKEIWALRIILYV